MKRLMDALKSAHRIELLIIAAMLCVLLVLSMGNLSGDTSLRSDAERRMERILSRIEGTGKVSVMLAEQQDGYLGCVVAAGGSDAQTMLELQRAVQALTGLELSRIEIVRGKG